MFTGVRGRQRSVNDSRELLAALRDFDASMVSPELATPGQYLKHLFWDVLHPHSTIRAIWDGWILLLLTALALILPVHISFSVASSVEIVRIENAIFLAIDGVFILDVLLNFRTAVWAGDQGEGVLKWKRRQIAVSYLHTWFLVDLLSSIPWPLLTRFMHVMSRGMASQGAECVAACEHVLFSM